MSKVTPAGVVTTFASGLLGPDGLAFDSAGNLYVAENFDGVNEVTPAGAVTTSPTPGSTIPSAWPSTPPATSTSPTAATTR